MTDNKDFYKTFFKNYGILSAIIVTVFVFLFYSVKLSRKSWNENLKKSVETVLEEKLPDEWLVGNPIRIKNSLSSSAVAYKIRNKKDMSEAVAVIIRIQSFYGPMPAVYICKTIEDFNYEEKADAKAEEMVKVEFVGYSSVHGLVERQLTFNGSDKRIQYWQKKIAYMLWKGDN